MAKPPIEIGLASEGRAFRQGIESDVIPPLEDAQKELKKLGESGEDTGDGLEDVGKAGKKSGEQLERAMREAQRESDRTRVDVEKLGDEIVAAGRKGKDFDAGVREGTTGASDAVREWGDEAKQNVAETFSSFRGDAEDLVGIVQDTFGGVISNLGPIGMAAGAAGAIGIGLIMGAYEKAQKAEEEFRESVAELAEALIDGGGEGAEGVRRIADGIKGLALETDDGKKKLTDVAREAKAVGVEVEGLAAAYAGSADALDEYGTKAIETAEAERQVARAQDAMTDSYGRASSATKDKIKDYTAVIDSVEKLKKQQAEAAEIERLWIESGGAAMEARAEQMDTLQGELDDAMGSWSDYQDAETGATDPAAYLANMQARMDATANFNSNVQTLAQQFGLTADEVQSILDQGVDFAPMLQSIMNAGMGEQYATQVRSMLDGGQSIIDGTSTTIPVEAQTDAASAAIDAAATDRTSTVAAKPETATASSALDAVAAKKRTATIDAKADTKAADAALDATATRSRTATINTYANTSGADLALANFMNRDRSITIRARVVDQRGQEVP
ncbi:hypothetical protein [Leucobacter sp. GX0328]